MKLRVFCLLLSLVLTACGTDQPEAVRPSVSGVISFLHLNDTYRIGAVEDGSRGGFGRVTTVIRELREKGNTVRLLHGGDFLYPSLESQLWNGQQMVEAFNFMHDLAPMLVVPGNHEFDRRMPDAVIDAIAASRFEWLADNLRLDTGRPHIDERMRSQYMTTIGDRKIGVFTLTIHPDHGGNVRDYTRFETGYIEHARRSIEAFEAAGADLIFGLTHLHLENDVEVANLKAEYPRFLFIVGGYGRGGGNHEGCVQRADNLAD